MNRWLPIFNELHATDVVTGEVLSNEIFNRRHTQGCLQQPAYIVTRSHLSVVGVPNGANNLGRKQSAVSCEP